MSMGTLKTPRPASLMAIFLLSSCCVYGQFPAVCNTPENIRNKICCPNDCGGEERGECISVVQPASSQSSDADADVIEILRNAPNVPEKGTADVRYLWPTVVFEEACKCKGNYWGVDCGECNFGWTGRDCNTKKTPVVRRSFASLSTEEKARYVEATVDLKKETGVWSAVVEEPPDYTSGTVTLQNISTYDVFVYMHNNVARDEKCGDVNMGVTVDFGHSGPAFPVWHRQYLLIVEREFQRVLDDESFGLPYWEWEKNDMSAFTEEYYGVPSNSYGPHENVTGDFINPENWHTVCDAIYRNESIDCANAWRPCNPEEDRIAARALQRGGGSTYLPNGVEVMVTLAAPFYDAKDEDGKYSVNSPRESFRSRIEGWNTICSADVCVGTRFRSRMHNNVHLWVGGHMICVPAAINDPVFNLHHNNVDRILESWMKRFTQDQLPPYVPDSGGHPGHNSGDYMVPFFPLMTPGEQYKVAEEWGYEYDTLITAGIPDDVIDDCDDVEICPTCDANATCIDCSDDQTCPEPGGIVIITPSRPDKEDEDDDTTAIGLGLGLGLGIPLFISIVIIIVLLIIIIKKSSGQSRDKSVDLTTKT